MKRSVLYNGDCYKKLKKIKTCSVDSIVTDPPYGLSFMNKAWDYDVPSVKKFKQMLRVAKPGAYMLAFAGSRTFHRMACNIEDAGWELRDCIMWSYSSGMPKGLNISKAIDKKAGATRKVIGKKKGRTLLSGIVTAGRETEETEIDLTEPATEEAKRWDGWNTCLKPSFEPILVAIKPLDGSYVQNILKWGVGGLNIKDTKIGKQKRYNALAKNSSSMLVTRNKKNEKGEKIEGETVEGRWPSNIILSHHTKCKFLGMKKIKSSSVSKNKIESTDNKKKKDKYKGYGFSHEKKKQFGYYDEDGMEEVENWKCVDECPCKIINNQYKELLRNDLKKIKGKFSSFFDIEELPNNISPDDANVSRFFYCPKPAVSEKHKGMDLTYEEVIKLLKPKPELKKKIKKMFKKWDNENIHPTIKPTNLMKYLIKLVTPKNGMVLDPFMGSATTGVSAIEDGFRFTGIEREFKYYIISKIRTKLAYKEFKKNKKKIKSLFK